MNPQGAVGPRRLEYRLKDLQRECDVLQKSVARLEQDLADTRQEHDDALTREGHALTRLDHSEEAQRDAEARVVAAETRAALADSGRVAAETRVERAQEEAEKLRADMEKMRKENEGVERELKTLRRRVHSQSQQLETKSFRKSVPVAVVKKEIEVIEISDDENDGENTAARSPHEDVHIKDEATQANRTVRATKSKVHGPSLASSSTGSSLQLSADEMPKVKFNKRPWPYSSAGHTVDANPFAMGPPRHAKRLKVEERPIKLDPGIQTATVQLNPPSIAFWRTPDSKPIPEDRNTAKSFKCSSDQSPAVPASPRGKLDITSWSDDARDVKPVPTFRNPSTPPRSASATSERIPYPSVDPSSPLAAWHLPSPAPSIANGPTGISGADLDPPPAPVPLQSNEEPFDALPDAEEPMWTLSDLSDLSDLTSSDEDDDDDDDDETESNAEGVASLRKTKRRARRIYRPDSDSDSYPGPSSSNSPAPRKRRKQLPRASGPSPNPLLPRVTYIPPYLIPTFTPSPTPVSRLSLTDTYSCAPRQLLGQISAPKNVPPGKARHMIWPEMDPNPGLPRARGEPGTVVSLREDMEELSRRRVKMALWVKVNEGGKARWAYFGEYVMKRCKEGLKKEEFCAFSERSQRKWARILVTSVRECFASLAARVWFHKNARGRTPTDDAVKAKTGDIVRTHKQWKAKHASRKDNPPPPEGLTEDDVVEGLRAGVVHLGVFELRCLEYDAAFEADVSAKWAAWAAWAKKKIRDKREKRRVDADEQGPCT